MPEQPSNPSQDEKLNLLLWQSMRLGKQLDEIEDLLVTVSSEQADFNADIADLTTFIQGLPAQIAAITAALQAQGVTDLSSLDALKTDVDAITPTLASLPGGTGTTGTPPASGAPSASGTTPSEA
jgi:hypothetical protein